MTPSVCTKICPAQLSVDVGEVQETVAPHTPGLLLRTILEGVPNITGNSVSLTVTV